MSEPAIVLSPLHLWHWEVNAYLVLYGSFLVGAIMRFLVRAGNAKRSEVSRYRTRLAYIADNWDIFSVRTGVALAIFSVWIFHPGILATVLKWFHVPGDLANWVPIVPGAGSAWLGGVFGDGALDKIQFRIGQKWPDANRYLVGELPAYTAFVKEAIEHFGS